MSAVNMIKFFNKSVNQIQLYLRKDESKIVMDYLFLSVINMQYINNDRYKGYEIKLSNNKFLRALISNEQLCCESFGCSLVEKLQSNHKLPDPFNRKYDLDQEKILMKEIQNKYFIGFQWGRDYETNDKKTTEILLSFLNYDDNQSALKVFSIVLYNDHNGFYPHDIVLENESENRMEIERL
jgi:hypothetical protein